MARKFEVKQVYKQTFLLTHKKWLIDDITLIHTVYEDRDNGR